MDSRPSGCSRRMRLALRAQGAGIAVVVIAVVLLIHYWPGFSGWATYFGHESGVFPAERSRYPLASPRNDIPGLPNFARVSRNLYRAAAADRAGLIRVKLMGVKTVIDLRQVHSDILNLKGLGLNYVRIPMNPANAEDEDVADFLHLVRNPDYQPLFVHCTHGSDRTGVIVAIYRVMEQNWAVEQAAQELPRFGFHEVWVPLLRYLKTFDRARLNALAASRPMLTVVRVP